MGTPLVNIPSFSVDNVVIYDEDFNIVFQDARIVKDSAKIMSKSFNHPLENGVILTDDKIQLPIELDLSVIVQSDNYRNTFEQLKKLYQQSEILIAQTRTTVFFNMYITDIPFEENPDMFDAITMVIKLREAQFNQPENEFFSPENETQSSVLQSGFKQTSEVTNTFQIASVERVIS